jgi:hypothetical protein
VRRRDEGKGREKVRKSDGDGEREKESFDECTFNMDKNKIYEKFHKRLR